jgi:hypothetical protein
MRAWIVLASTAIVLGAGPARAADPTPKACNAAYEQAQVLRKANKLRAARQELLTCSQAKCPGAITADCGPWLREVEGALPSIVVVARDASGADVPAVKVSVDGAPLASRLKGEPIEVDPGEHTFVFEPEKGQRVEQTLIINVGEKNRLVQVAVRPESAPAQKGAEPAPAPPPAEEKKDERKGGMLWPGFVAGGIGLASLGASIGLWAKAKSDLSALRSSCAPHCQAAQVDPIKTKGVISDVTFGVGVAGLGASVLLFVLLRPTEKEKPAGAQLVVAPTAGGVTAGVIGRF